MLICNKNKLIFILISLMIMKKMSASRCDSLHQSQVSSHHRLSSDTKAFFDFNGKALSNITLPARACY